MTLWAGMNTVIRNKIAENLLQQIKVFNFTSECKEIISCTSVMYLPKQFTHLESG